MYIFFDDTCHDDMRIMRLEAIEQNEQYLVLKGGSEVQQVIECKDNHEGAEFIFGLVEKINEGCLCLDWDDFVLDTITTRSKA